MRRERNRTLKKDEVENEREEEEKRTFVWNRRVRSIEVDREDLLVPTSGELFRFVERLTRPKSIEHVENFVVLERR